MNAFTRLDERLRSEETSQLLAALLVLLLLVLLFTWSGNPQTRNDSWYSVMAVRLGGLTLLSIWWAARSSQSSVGVSLGGFSAVAVAAAVSLPFELVAFAGSYPAASLPLTVLFGLSFPLGLYGVTLLLARPLGRAWFLAVPAAVLLISLIFVIDGLTGIEILNPITTLTADNWLPAASWSAIALATALWLLLPGKERTDE